MEQGLLLAGEGWGCRGRERRKLPGLSGRETDRESWSELGRAWGMAEKISSRHTGSRGDRVGRRGGWAGRRGSEPCDAEWSSVDVPLWVMLLDVRHWTLQACICDRPWWVFLAPWGSSGINLCRCMSLACGSMWGTNRTLLLHTSGM